jgi:uncharacterized protein
VLDGHVLVDAHMHVGKLTTVSPAWRRWAGQFGDADSIGRVYDHEGVIIPERFSELLDAEGVDGAMLFSEYSPKAGATQPIEDLLPVAKHDPHRVRLVANLNPHLHFPVVEELERQLGYGAVALKLHPVHAGFPANERALYPAYEVCRSR